MPENSKTFSSSASELSRVTTSVLHTYGSVAFPLAAAFIALQVIIPTFYAETTGLSLTTIGLVLLAARLWDLFTDPIVGTLSDRTPARFGKRKAWMVMATPIIMLATWQLFVPPADADWTHLLVWTFLIYVGGTMAIVPMNAWSAELSSDYDERSRISGTRAGYGLLGTIVALLLTALASGETNELQQPLRWIALMAIATLAITATLTALRVPDRSPTALPDNTLKAALKLLRTPGPFRQLLVSFLFNSVGNAIPATLFLLYVAYVLQVPEMAGKLLFMYFLCAAISVPFWIKLAKYFGKHQTWIFAILLTCVFFCAAPFLSYETRTVFYAIVLFTGITAGADLVLPVAIKADLIEWDEYSNGYKRPGVFFAIWGTTTKLAFGLAIGIAFPLLEFAGFSTGTAKTGSANAEEVSTASGIIALAFLYGGPSIFFKILASWLMRGYPITRTEHERIRNALQERKTTTESTQEREQPAG